MLNVISLPLSTVPRPNVRLEKEAIVEAQDEALARVRASTDAGLAAMSELGDMAAASSGEDDE